MKIHTFIGRLIRQIPDKYLPMIRYAGLFANRWKKKYLSQCRIALNQPEPDDTDVYFAGMFGTSPDIAFYALRRFLISKKDTLLYGNAMIAVMAQQSLEPTKISMEKS